MDVSYVAPAIIDLAASYPLRITETKKDFQMRKIDLEPFMADFRTLASLWLAELPFGLISAAPIPNPEAIRKFSIAFSELRWNGDTKTPVFTLLFADWKDAASVADDLRASLLSDEKANNSANGRRFRKSCAIVTVWQWDMKSETATFWMDGDSVNRMKEKGWHGMILRMDNWLICSKPVDLKESLKTEGKCVMN